jgi:hypothetical protein
MATSFITKDDTHGFWIPDSIMQVVCWGMMNAIDGHPDFPPLVRNEFRKHLFDCSQGYFVGFMYLGFDDYFKNEGDMDVFKDVLVDTENFFRSKGESISVEELNAFQLEEHTRSTWVKPLETKRLINILDYLKDLADDKITTKSGDEINYSF